MGSKLAFMLTINGISHRVIVSLATKVPRSWYSRLHGWLYFLETCWRNVVMPHSSRKNDLRGVMVVDYTFDYNDDEHQIQMQTKMMMIYILACGSDIVLSQSKHKEKSGPFCTGRNESREIHQL